MSVIGMSCPACGRPKGQPHHEDCPTRYVGHVVAAPDTPRPTPPPGPPQPETEAGRRLLGRWDQPMRYDDVHAAILAIERESMCVLTTWTRDAKGYGVGHVPGIGNRRAHRWAWEQAHGPIPDGMQVLHRCDNPPCINVAHLFLGTPADNMADRDAKGHTATGDRNGSRRHPEARPRGLAMRHPQPGSANGRARLTEADVPVIRERAAHGETARTIAADYGLNPTTVRRLLSGRYWSHV